MSLTFHLIDVAALADVLEMVVMKADVTGKCSESTTATSTRPRLELNSNCVDCVDTTIKTNPLRWHDLQNFTFQ